jgi:hypothetical protein
VKPHIETNPDMQRCIDNCSECQEMCLVTAQHCLTEGGSHAEAGHIGSLLDCARTCQLSAELMVRDSPLHPRVCAVCAEACERCAEDCERFSDDLMMQQCAEACRRSMKSCREMANMRG